MARNGAFTTLLTNEKYLPGIFVVARSLQDVRSKYPLVVMTVQSTPAYVLEALHRTGIKTRVIAELMLKPDANGPAITAHDSRFLDVWAKLRAFSLAEYDRVILIDSDMIIRKNMDELFDMDLPAKSIAAAHVCACNPWKLSHYPPDWIPENCAHSSVKHPKQVPAIESSSPRPYSLLNSGTVVLNPSAELDAEIEEFMHTSPLLPTWTFPDQDLLSAFFAGRWRPLAWYYNALITLSQVHKPLWADDEVRCLHYIGLKKPWAGRKAADARYQRLVDWWWVTFDNLEQDLKERDAATWELIARNTTPQG